jgi:dual adaptor for phosphotyrosine/3-phosphotyrosine/3-phosphoinositide
MTSSYYNVYSKPDMMVVPWYHPGLTRNAAEALLLTSGKDGSYLMRDASDGSNWSVSVRSHNAVRHFQLLWDGKKFKFGLAQFMSIDEMLRHFDNQPLMSGESGVAVTLLYPYPKNVSEPAIYERPTVHAEMGRLSGEPSFSPVLAIGSKEGYLYKIGAIRRNWQRRWFVVFKNEVRYYKRKGDSRPIRIINLEDATEIDNIDVAGKPFCIKVVTPKRTFIFQASSEGEKTEWLVMLKWKLEHIQKSNGEQQ